jgi:hypothetical protein
MDAEKTMRREKCLGHTITVTRRSNDCMEITGIGVEMSRKYGESIKNIKNAGPKSSSVSTASCGGRKKPCGHWTASHGFIIGEVK